MIIGILTQPLRLNYGGILQNYALQQVLINLGHMPITIDLKSKVYPNWYIKLSRLKQWLSYLINPIYKKKPPYILTHNEDMYIRKNSIAFINEFIKRTYPCASTLDFRNVISEYKIDAYVVGSDQCWRPSYNMYPMAMFLDFCRDLDIKKRIAYAASFGSDKWEFSPEETIECADLAKLFNVITTREDTGVDLCRKHLGVDAINVLDPTMLLEREFYEQLIKRNQIAKSKGELFSYILDPTTKLKNFINNISVKTGYKSFDVLPQYNEDHRVKEDIKKRIDDCVYPSPLVWIKAFIDAKMIIVDSFHGAVFSIIFNKPFWVVGNKERGMARFNSLLLQFGLKDRLISENQLDDIDIYAPIDWEVVNEILIKKRKESINVLKYSLE